MTSGKRKKEKKVGKERTENMHISEERVSNFKCNFSPPCCPPINTLSLSKTWMPFSQSEFNKANSLILTETFMFTLAFVW